MHGQRWLIRSCRLCEQSCPFNAINKSSLVEPVSTVTTDKRRLGWLFVAAPAILAASIWLGGLTGQAMVRKHPRVNLAERIHFEEAGQVAGTTDASAAYRGTGKPLEELFDEATAIRARYIKAGRWCGGWIGLVIAGKLIALAMKRRRKDYEADQMRCVACARCYIYCPQEHLRIQNVYGIPMPPAMAEKAVTPP